MLAVFIDPDFDGMGGNHVCRTHAATSRELAIHFFRTTNFTSFLQACWNLELDDASTYCREVMDFPFFVQEVLLPIISDQDKKEPHFIFTDSEKQNFDVQKPTFIVDWTAAEFEQLATDLLPKMYYIHKNEIQVATVHQALLLLKY